MDAGDAVAATVRRTWGLIPDPSDGGVCRTPSAPLKTGGESRMKESSGKDPASHPDPESCVGSCKDAGEALTGAHAGQPSSCDIRSSGVPTRLCEAEGHIGGGVIGQPSSDPAQSETLGTRGNSSHGKREIP